MLNWGILSTARIGTKSVIPAIQASSNGTALAICSRDLAAARQVAAQFGIPRAYGSYEALLDDPDVQAIYNPLPNSLHREWTIRAAEKSKHVLCEKPLALNAAECDEMIAACQQHGVLLMEAFMYRFHPQMTQVKELIESGAVGQVQIIRASFTFVMSDPDNIRLRPELGGGALMDVGCYGVNVARFVTSAEPVAVQAMAYFGHASRVDELLAGLLRFPGDEIAIIDCGFRSLFRQSVEIVGNVGKIEIIKPFIPRTDPAPIVLTRGDESETLVIPGANHYQRMVEHFADCILTGQPLRYPPEDGRNNMRVIDALYQAAKG